LVIFFSSANVKIRAPRSCGTLVLVLFISKDAADGSATSFSNQHACKSGNHDWCKDEMVDKR
jgi:hypothetical protein